MPTVEEQVADDLLYGEASYNTILRPAESGDLQDSHTDREKVLKEVLHRLKDAHRVQTVELIEARLEVGRLRSIMEEKRYEQIKEEMAERSSRKVELEHIRSALRDSIEAQKEVNAKLNLELRQSEDVIYDKDREITDREAAIQDKQREIEGKNRDMEELRREIAQYMRLVGDTRDQRDSHDRAVQDSKQLIQQLNDKIRDKDQQLRHMDDDAKMLREHVEKLNTRNKDLERINKELEAAIAKTKLEAELNSQQLEMKISELNFALEESKLQSQRFSCDSDYTEKTIQDLLDDNKDKEELVYKTTAVVLQQQRREQEQQDETRARMYALSRKVEELKEVDNQLYAVCARQRKVTHEPWGTPCPTNTLVQCSPNCSPTVGQQVNILIITRNREGVPVKGANVNDFKIFVGGKDVGAPEVVFDHAESAGGKGKLAADKESSTFQKIHFATQIGWNPVVVFFHGEEIHSGFMANATLEEGTRAIEKKWDSCEVDDADRLRNRDMLLLTPGELQGTITVSVAPGEAEPGDKATVVVVVHDSVGRPKMGGPDLSGELELEPFFSVPMDPSWRRCIQPLVRHEQTGIYTAELQIPLGSFELCGATVQRGGALASGACKMIAKGSDRVDLSKTTIACTPDPCSIGDTVTALITTRNERYKATPLEDAQSVLFSVKNLNGASKISSVRNLSPTQWYFTFHPDRPGRCGLQVDYAANEMGKVSVEVIPAGKPDPDRTEVLLNPNNEVKRGQRVKVNIKLRDADGRLAAGPAPQLIQINTFGPAVKDGPRKLHALSRGRVDGDYHTHFTVADNAQIGDSVGVEIELEGGSARGSVMVSDDTSHKEPPPAKPVINAAFIRDPVRAGDAVFLLVESPVPPQVTALSNVETIGEPFHVRSDLKDVYLSKVIVGTKLAGAIVAVDAAGKKMKVSTTVSAMPLRDLDIEIQRLKDLEYRFKEAFSLDPKAALDKIKASSPSRRNSTHSKTSPSRRRSSTTSPRKTPEKPSSPKKVVTQYPVIGVELSDGLQAGDHTEQVRGAKVVDTKPGGPGESAGLREGDVIQCITPGGGAPVDIDSKDDIKKVIKALGNKAPFADLTLQILRNGKEVELTLTPGVSEKAVAGKRHARGTMTVTRASSTKRKSRSASVTTPKRKSSVSSKRSRTSRSTSKSPSKRSGSKKKKSTTKKRSKSKSKSKKGGPMVHSEFKAARKKTGGIGSMMPS